MPYLSFGFGIFAIQQIIKQPDVALLFSEHGAEWIRFREPFVLKARGAQEIVSFFRVHFDVNQVPSKAILKFYAMKAATVWFDKQLLYAPDSLLDNWKNVDRVDFTPMLTPGRHELQVAVLNQNGHPALLAYCESLNIFSGKGWEASRDGKTWTRAMTVNETPSIHISRRFQRADRALFSNLYVFSPIFVIIFICSLVCSRKDRYPWTIYFIPTAATVRWILLVAWVVLAVNNIGKIPLHMGMDIIGHIKYVLYVVDNGRIPLPTEGWQMFQAPFFYMISAIICKFFLNFFSVETVARILRILPLICGATQIELSYRALRYIYPTRRDLQVLGTVVGGLLPMNVYISQVFGNEPLAGCLSAIGIVVAFRLICSSSFPSARSLSLMGLFLGLAILTKTTALLFVPPLIIFISYVVYRNTNSFSIARRTALVVRSMVLLLGVSFLVAGWYYVRNWIEFGQFFVSGWNPS